VRGKRIRRVLKRLSEKQTKQVPIEAKRIKKKQQKASLGKKSEKKKRTNKQKKIEAQAAILKRNSAEVGDLRQLRGDQWGTRAAETARRWGRKNRRGERIDWKISGSVGGKEKNPGEGGGNLSLIRNFFPPQLALQIHSIIRILPKD